MKCGVCRVAMMLAAGLIVFGTGLALASLCAHP